MDVAKEFVCYNGGMQNGFSHWKRHTSHLDRFLLEEMKTAENRTVVRSKRCREFTYNRLLGTMRIQLVCSACAKVTATVRPDLLFFFKIIGDDLI